MEEAALAQPLTHQLTSLIPHQIYQPLLEIAKHGYDANEIMRWYITMRSYLQRNDTTDSTATYSLTPPFSVCSPASHDPQASSVRNDDASPVQAVIRPQNLYESPITNWNLWPESFAFQPCEPNQLEMTTTTPLAPPEFSHSSVECQNNLSALASPWRPATPIFPNYNISGPSVVRDEANPACNNVSNSMQWFSAGPPNSMDNAVRKRRASQPIPYYTAISSTAMPLLLPSSSFQPDGQPITSSGLSTEVTYLPPISIIPSRKRRKTMPKGVKKFIQPLQLQRQSIV